LTTIQTVLGPIDAAHLGATLSHEHVLVAQGEDNRHYPWMFDWQATADRCVRELAEAKTHGVDAIIDLTTPDLGRDVRFVQEVSRRSGVHVVVATGLWLEIPRPFRSRDPDRAAEIFVHEIEEGIEGTDIKAAVIKVASDEDGVTAAAERVLRGAARALKRTGCPISTHQYAPGGVGRRQVEILEDEGVPMDRVCIGHSADTTDVDYLDGLLQRGVYLSMDRYPGGGRSPDWRQRNATVKALIERGWAHRLMLGHDHGPVPIRAGREQSPTTAGTTRYAFLTTEALPALQADGVGEDVINLMLRNVPRAFLTGESQT
jgi:phosphotriesterase-related protein